MPGFLNEIAPTLAFPTDERKVRCGAVVLANWRTNGLLIARLKLREAMKIVSGFARCQLSKVMFGTPGSEIQFSPAVNLVM